MNAQFIIVANIVVAVVVSLLLTGLFWGITKIIRKKNPELGAKIDEFWNNF